MITTHTQLLNALISKYDLKSYLEIGVNNPDANFNHIRCNDKWGIDPSPHESALTMNAIHLLTSDEYFDACNDKYDLIFLDGLHHADQVKRDFENSLRCLSDNGFILIHDVLPENEAGTAVPRATKQWWGDVYKWAMNICLYNGIGYKTFNIDNGCMLVWKDNTAIGNNKIDDLHNNYDRYLRFGRELMNVTDTVEI